MPRKKADQAPIYIDLVSVVFLVYPDGTVAKLNTAEARVEPAVLNYVTRSGREPIDRLPVSMANYSINPFRRAVSWIDDRTGFRCVLNSKGELTLHDAVAVPTAEDIQRSRRERDARLLELRAQAEKAAAKQHRDQAARLRAEAAAIESEAAAVDGAADQLLQLASDLIDDGVEPTQALAQARQILEASGQAVPQW